MSKGLPLFWLLLLKYLKIYGSVLSSPFGKPLKKPLLKKQPLETISGEGVPLTPTYPKKRP